MDVLAQWRVSLACVLSLNFYRCDPTLFKVASVAVSGSQRVEDV